MAEGQRFGVDQQSSVVAEMAQNWELIADLVGGTSAMRKAGKKYLPQFPKEEPAAYQDRLNAAVLFPAFAHTASVLAAKPLSRPITITDLPSRVEELLPDIDMFGTPLAAFAGQVMLACMRPGLEGVMVDVPPAEGVRTKAEEQAAGVRPYFTRYPAKSILGWRAQRNAKGYFLTQLRLMEEVCEPDGEWGDKIVPQVRVLEPGSWKLYRKTATDGNAPEWTLYQEGETTIQAIPFVFFYGIRYGFGIGAPPLLHLAHMNVEHWQSASDQQNIVHVARVPILFAKGFSDGDQILIGAGQAASSTSENADLKYVEHSGAAIGAGRQAILDLEDRMRQAGAELLVQRPAITTATQVQSEDEATRSIMQQIAEEFEESLACCLALACEWVGERNAKPKVELYKDFGSANLSEKSGDLLLRAAKDGHVSSETAFKQLQRMDAVPADVPWEDEKRRIDAEMVARSSRAPKPAETGDGEGDPRPNT